MTDDLLKNLAELWLESKEREKQATDLRRDIEDKIKSLVGVSENSGSTETVLHDDYIIKIVGRIDRKVDSDLLQEVAAESGLTDHLQDLFRWKAEIKMDAWKLADKQITNQLSKAITSKPGRASFSIEPNKKNKQNNKER